MKAYVTTHLVLDHANMSGQEVVEAIENVNYPSDCISPTYMGWAELDIGEWDDDHPLNKTEVLQSKPMLAELLSKYPLTDHQGRCITMQPNNAVLVKLIAKVQEAFKILHAGISEEDTDAAYEVLESLLLELNALPKEMEASDA